MIYLDNAATTFPKPKCLPREISRCINEYCGNPGRSGHTLSLKAAEKIYDCRETLARFFGSSKPENVIFTLNTTYALNIAIKSLFTPHSHVLISNMEHNSVLRPIHALYKEGKIEYSIFNVMQSTENIILELGRKIRDNTSMIVMTHASNICAKIFPVKAVGAFCQKHNITFVVDGAQSAGISEIRVDDWNIDALCVPAHKGLYGPQGLGFIIFGNKQPIRTIIEGGNGINSLSKEMGTDIPESFESGTMPTPLIAGLDASVKWVSQIGIDNINRHEVKLSEMLKDRLLSIKGSCVYGPENNETGVVLYSNNNITVNKISAFLDSEKICTRSGFHCAPLAHNSLSTTPQGALRFSLSYFNTKQEIDLCYYAIKSIK